MPERLQKLISACGLMSRRQAEKCIVEGRVRLNGRVAQLGEQAELPGDQIEVDGVPLLLPRRHTTLLLYKPRGFVTTSSDERGRRTVTELVPEGERLYPVGRLDQFSEGLLLMTNDGALAQKLTHPRSEIEKVYELWVSQWRQGAEQSLREPIEIDGKKTRPAGVRLLWQRGETARLEITLREGRNRQIRRLCERAGVVCTRLKRVREGKLTLGELRPGEYRALTGEELQYLNEL